MKKYNFAIFDLDGTILDTLCDLRNSVNFALSKNNLPERTTEEIRQFVGNGIRLLIERAVPENTSDNVTDMCFDDFKVHYKDNSANLTKPYGGVVEMLNELKNNGIKLAVVSNKADFAVQGLIKQYFPDLFDFSVGERDGIKRKPSPDSVFAAMKHLDADKADTIYIGDSEVDIETANNSGVPCIAVTWGFRDKDVLKKLNPQYIVNEPKEIIDIFLK